MNSDPSYCVNFIDHLVLNQKGAFKNGNFKLNYCIEGMGPEVLVIGSAVYYPRTFSQNLRKKLRLAFIDHRGFGKNTASLTSEDYTLDVIIDDVEEMRKKLGLSRVIVVGHSGHGYMALEYAKKYPNSVSHLILLAMSPNGNQNNYLEADRYFEECAGAERKLLLKQSLMTLEKDIQSNPDRAFILRALKFALMIWYDPHFNATKLWEGVNVIPEIMDYLWNKVFQKIDISNNLSQLNIPIFLGLGRHDYWNPPYLWENAKRYFNDLTIQIFEKSGHTPQLEESELFDQELLQWLSLKNLKII